jgi:hypothetical protein
MAHPTVKTLPEAFEEKKHGQQDASPDMSRIIRLFSGFVTVGTKVRKALRQGAAGLS